MSYSRDDIARLRRQLQEAENSVHRSEMACNHNWTKPEYTLDYREGYTQRGTSSYTGSSGYIPYDEQPYAHDFYVPAERKDKWTRRCTKCGKKEVTTQSTDKVKKIPKF